MKERGKEQKTSPKESKRMENADSSSYIQHHVHCFVALIRWAKFFSIIGKEKNITEVKKLKKEERIIIKKNELKNSWKRHYRNHEVNIQ